MSAPTIIGYTWDLGNGETSNEALPANVYFEGSYDITVLLSLSDGTTTRVSANDFIIVTEVNKNFFQEGYLKDPSSFHYGYDQELAGGWSRNIGDEWIWPESAAAISNVDINGTNWLYVWDIFDDKQYCINTQNTTSSVISYLDKDVNEIESSVTLGGHTAQDRMDVISHLETSAEISNDIDASEIAVGLEISLGLITTPGDLPIETIENIESGVEQSFREQINQFYGDKNIQQLKVSSNKSKFNIQEVNSVYKRTRQAMAAPIPVDTPTEDFFVSAVSNWISTPDYSLDKWTGNFVDITSNSLVSGPIDGTRGLALASSLDIGNILSTGCVFLLSTSAPTISGISLTEYGTLGGYTGYYYNGSIPADLTINSGVSVFDIRILAGTITETLIDSYLSDISGFIPGV